MHFDAVVAIARGGLAPAIMAASALSLPLFALSYARPTRAIDWFTLRVPAAGARVLLVEDVAGRGTTLVDCRDFLLKAGYSVVVFTLAYDSESRIRPDFGLEMPNGAAAWFPWERETITAAFAATGNRPDRSESDYASWAVDLDGVLVPDLPSRLYDAATLDIALALRDALAPCTVLPPISLAQVAVITGRPEQDRARTQGWLTRHGYRGVLRMRDPRRHDAAGAAAHKADCLLEYGHTHFIESDPGQAIEIARRVPVGRIFWWDGGQAIALSAHVAAPLARA
ncbi:MAG: phosphoribosyltransferase [Candidimonas sp.]|nr:MAG: phosphoribosyltransferase [Candidimonas sp.]TAM24336.1 MAG: phosphoribosyltransferase [Candidimonas sp.]TAM81245.1 MAG: phosphoribosyltransferase [Candidimonas sp.]